MRLFYYSQELYVSGWRLFLFASEELPANTTRRLSVELTLGQRLRRWASSNSTLGQCIVFAGELR